MMIGVVAHRLLQTVATVSNTSVRNRNHCGKTAMARPISASDEEILEAASAVMARRGADGFSVAEVAREIGLSRAAITFRFKSAEDLRARVLDRFSTSFEKRLATLRGEPGAAGLLEIAEFVGRLAGGQRGFSAFLLNYTANMQNDAQRRMEVRRGEVLRAAIARVMPPLAIPRDAAVNAFMAHVTGSLMAWYSFDTPDAGAFLRERTEHWLVLTGIVVEAGDLPRV
jgi:AcrR family transcriptional regulator